MQDTIEPSLTANLTTVFPGMHPECFVACKSIGPWGRLRFPRNRVTGLVAARFSRANNLDTLTTCRHNRWSPRLYQAGQQTCETLDGGPQPSRRIRFH